MDPNLTLLRTIESARNLEFAKRQKGTIKSIVNSYKIKSCSSKEKDCPWCKGYKAHGKSRWPANNSHCFKCGKLGHFKKACHAQAVKFIEETSNISSIVSNKSRSNINKPSISQDKSYFLGTVSNHKFYAHKPIINILVNGEIVKFRIDTRADKNCSTKYYFGITQYCKHNAIITNFDEPTV